ncbi:DUF4347 domain-containing protein [Pseudomonas sp. BIGb0427]|uniref:DUF4347 domain-containing protein n=1 Tax=Pseudomonas sp. BIGb0427 TaxID=2724470 RepID=UPI0018A7B72B|nr:DUF4347 domain-containing protein [Pseudomonas sp. BIGb0427]QPG62359.1 DUF4347 domain-containing protein [Pseudomonas sp. BIGb0427]
MKFIDRFKRQGRPVPTPAGQAPLLFALEPRIMFDASVAVVAQEATAEAAKDTGKDSASDTAGADKAALATADTRGASASERHEVVFVDGQISNPQEALKGLPAGSEVVVLDPGKDGLQQMADYLKGRSDLDAIHVFSHGASGTVQLGNVWLSSSNLADHGETLQSIGQSLKADGDLMLYGCQVGKDDAGQAFVSQLASLTGADIGASSDDTGSGALGGNWTLERSSGPLATTALALNDYQGLLATSWSTGSAPLSGTTIAAGSRVVVGDFDNDGDADILYQTGGNGSLWAFARSNGNGSFTLQSLAQSPFAGLSLPDHTGSNYHVADFDGDGDLDVLAGVNSTTGTYLRNDGGSFSSQSTASFPAPAAGSRMLAADFDNDGDADLLYQTGANGTGFAYARSNGNGTFTLLTLAQSPFAGLTLPDHNGSNYYAADIDGDGDIDVLAGSNATTGVYLRNDGASFSSQSTASFPAPAAFGRMVLADFDSDGDADILYQTGGNGTAFAYARSNGDGTFTLQTLAQSPLAGLSLVDHTGTTYRAADFDGDGDIDLYGGFNATAGNLYVQNDRPPIVVSSTPSDNASNVDTNANIVLTFNEAVSKGSSGSIYIVRTFDNVVVQTIAIGSAQISGSGTTWTIALPVPLALGTGYAIRLDAKTFVDGDGAIFKGVKNNTTLNFTTKSNDPPVLSNLNGDSNTFIEGGAPVLLDAGGNALLTDLDSADFNGGNVTVAITANRVSGEDLLGIFNQGSGAGQIGVSGSNVTYAGVIIGSFAGGSASSNLVISLNSNATAAAVQALVRNLTYSNSNNGDISTAARTVQVSINDGDSSSDASALVSVNVSAVNDAPTVTASGGTPTFTEGGAPVDLFSAVVVSTVEAGQGIKQLTFTVSNVSDPGNERLTLDGSNIDLVNGASGTTAINGFSYSVTLSGATATVTLTKAAGISSGLTQTLIDGVQYSNLSHAPTIGTRVISLSGVADTGGTSNGGADSTSLAISATVTVQASNDAPSLSGGPFVLPGTDEDSSSSGQLIASILAGLSHGDVDGAGSLSGVAVIGSSGNGFWQYSSNGFSWADIGAVSSSAGLLLSSTAQVRFVPDGTNAGSASLTLRAWDQTSGTASSNSVRRTGDTTINGGSSSFSVGTAQAQITISAVNDAPLLTPTAPVLIGITDGQLNNPGQTVASFLSGVTDVDTGALVGIAITGLNSGTGTWQYSTDGSTWSDIGAVAGNSALLLRGSDKLRLVPDGANAMVATLTYKAWDQTGASAGQQGSKVDTTASGASTAFSIASDTASITVTAVNDAPNLSTSAGSAHFVEGNNGPSTPVVIDSGLTLSDSDNSTLASARVSIIGNFQGGFDVLAFTNNPATMGNISASYDVSTGVLTLTSAGAAATLAQWQAALASVTFSNQSESPSTATRTLSFVVNDGTLDSPAATRTLTVATVDDTPVIATSGGSETYFENAGPVAIDSGLTLSDIDSNTLASATISITGNFRAGQDVLEFSSGSPITGNINASYNAATGVLTLTSAGATATLWQWQVALQSVGYRNVSDNPDTSTRTVSFSVNDGNSDSAVASKAVNIQAVNDAGILSVPSSLNFNEDASGTVSGISISDADAGSGQVTLTLSVALGQLHANSGAGVTVNTLGSGLILVGSVADINAFIAANGVSYIGAANGNGNVNLTVTYNDGGNTGSGGAQLTQRVVTLAIGAVNDAPVNQVPSSQNVLQDGSLTFNNGNGNLISISDVDAGSAALQVTLTASNGLLTLSSLSGLVFTVGSGTGDASMTFTGSQSDINAALNGLVFSPVAGYHGSASLQITTSDLGGSGSGGAQTDTDTVSINVASLNPRVTDVSAQSANGSYKTGDSITLTLTFDQMVSVDTTGGIPALLLETGLIDRYATYVAGSGTNTLTFQYTVQAGDTSADLDYAGSAALALNGAVIRNATFDNAVLTLPTPGSAHSLGANHNLVIDGIAPQVTSVSVPANGTYVAGQQLDFTVNLSEAVTVTGTPRLQITLDTGGTVFADYLSGSGTGALVFRLTVSSGQLDSNGITLGSNLVLNGGSVRDQAGNLAVATLNNVGSTTGVNVDAVAPVIGSVAVPAAGSYKAGDVLSFTVNASEALIVDTSTGTPRLQLTIGGLSRYASYVSGSGSGQLLFQYSVDAGVNDADGIQLGSTLDLNGGTLRDAAGNGLVLALNGLGSTAGVLVDTLAPSAGALLAIDASPSNAGSVRYNVTFSEAVSGVDTSDFSLVFSGTANGSISSVTSLDGRTYSVLVSGLSGVGSLRLDLNSSATGISDAAGNSLSNGQSGTSYQIDRVAPTVNSVTVPADGNYVAGQHLDFTVNLSEAVMVTGTPRLQITLDTGGTVFADYLSGSGTGALVFRLTVSTGQLDSTGISLGSGLVLNGGALRDSVGNDALISLNNVASTSGVLVDAVLPTVASVSVPAAGSYNAGDVLSFTVNASEALIVDTSAGTPRLQLTIGGLTRYASYVSGSGSGQLVFQYSVQVGNNDADGIQVGSTLDLNGGTVRDAAGNPLNLGLNGLASTTGVRIDTAAPQVADIVRVDVSPSNSGSLRYTVSFDESVSGVDLADFSLAFSASASGRISSVTQLDGRTYSVLVDNLSGVGTLRLDLNPTGTGITDAAGNALAGGLQGSSYSIDRVAPSVTAVAVPAAGSYVAGQGLEFSVQLDEAVLVDTADGAPRLAVTLDNGRVVYADYVSGSGSNTLVFRLTISPGLQASNGLSVAPSLDLNGSTVRDARGNDAGTGLSNVASTAGILVDARAPRPAEIVVQTPATPGERTLSYTLSFDEAVSGVDAADFSVLSSGSATGVVQSVQQLDARTYRVTLGSISGQGGLGLSLNALNSGIRDGAGNALAVSMSSPLYQLPNQDVGDLEFRVNPPVSNPAVSVPLLQPQVPQLPSVASTSPMLPAPLFEERTLGSGIDTLGSIFIHNGLSAPSFIAQVFASSDGSGDGSGQGFLGFGGGDGGVFGTSTFAALFAREAAPEGESMRVFDGKQWRTTDPAQGLRAVFGAASLEQQLQDIKDAEQRPVRELAMALAQPTQIGNRT